jgi:DnaJ like chaperone protein
MSKKRELPELPARLESALCNLLPELASCGHNAEKLIRQRALPRGHHKPLFFFLGHIAKADGRVTETDIRFAESLIKALELSSRQRRKAIQQFQQGKQADELPLYRSLWFRLRAQLKPAETVKVAICLCHGAQIHGQPGKARRYRCEDSIARLGLPVTIADEIFESYASKVWAQTSAAKERPVTYEHACRILGVTRRDSLTDIKRTYRKKVSACHPDKLAQQKLTPSERAMAKDQLLSYQQAWELIQKRHRIK